MDDLTFDNCARCGERHEQLTPRRLAQPHDPSGPEVYTHWVPCPTNGEPILIAQVDTEASWLEQLPWPLAVDEIKIEGPTVTVSLTDGCRLVVPEEVLRALDVPIGHIFAGLSKLIDQCDRTQLDLEES